MQLVPHLLEMFGQHRLEALVHELLLVLLYHTVQFLFDGLKVHSSDERTAVLEALDQRFRRR